MGQEEDPMRSHTGAHPWLPVEDAVYVIGIERRGVMGEPVLVYANRSKAERAMQGHSDARMLDMAGLRNWWKALQGAR